MTTTNVNLCVGCIHYTRDSTLRSVRPTSDLNPAASCAAFPTLIPAEIFDGTIDHRQPYLGDHGIQFTEQLSGTVTAYDLTHRTQRPAHRVRSERSR